MDLCVKTLAALGRNYLWQRPECCPRCHGGRVWGHGFVAAYFDQAGSECVYLKRYRCPDCRVVIRVRPLGYWRRDSGLYFRDPPLSAVSVNQGALATKEQPGAPASLA